MIFIFNAVICIKYFAVPRGNLKISLIPPVQPDVTIVSNLSLLLIFPICIPDVIIYVFQSR